MPHMELGRARRLMRQRGVDVLIANTHDNVYYASGFNDWLADWLPIITIVPLDSSIPPIMITSSFREAQARRRSCIEDIRTYSLWMPIIDLNELVNNSAKATQKPPLFNSEYVFSILSDVLKEKGLHESVIGIEKNLFNNREGYAVLVRQNPKAKFIEANDIFMELRRVKTEDEIKALRVAADLTVKGFQTLTDGGVLGATIGELYLRYKRGILQAATADNAMDLENMRLEISSGDHFRSNEDPQYKIGKGDIVWVDNGVTVFGYSSDMGRTLCVGQPNPLQKKLFEALMAGYDEAIKLVKPGVKMKEIHRTLQETVRQKGFEWYGRGTMGHTSGIGWPSQAPYISADEETVLEPNMVLCVECGVYVVGRFGAFQIEDMLLVTAGGHEILTKLPLDMIEL